MQSDFLRDFCATQGGGRLDVSRRMRRAAKKLFRTGNEIQDRARARSNSHGRDTCLRFLRGLREKHSYLSAASRSVRRDFLRLAVARGMTPALTALSNVEMVSRSDVVASSF